jgi:hypothetical protein
MGMTNKAMYIKAKGLSCPFCGGDSLEGGFVEIQAGKAFQQVACCECGNTWQDIYELVDMAPLEREHALEQGDRGIDKASQDGMQDSTA